MGQNPLGPHGAQCLLGGPSVLVCLGLRPFLGCVLISAQTGNLGGNLGQLGHLTVQWGHRSLNRPSQIFMVKKSGVSWKHRMGEGLKPGEQGEFPEGERLHGDLENEEE